jgi:predicted transcriptional regulator
VNLELQEKNSSVYIFLEFCSSRVYYYTMKLEKYLKIYRLNCTQFSRISKIPQPTIWRIYNGKTRPTARIAKAIEKATDGKVSANELVFG